MIAGRRWDLRCRTRSTGYSPHASAMPERVERFPARGDMDEREERDERTASVRAAFEDSIAAKRATLEACAGAIAAAAERVIECFRAGHKLLAFGNGGSASDAQHLCARARGPLRARAPRAARDRAHGQHLGPRPRSATTTATTGCSRAWSRRTAAPATSRSRSPRRATRRNVLEAVAAARQRGIATIGSDRTRRRQAGRAASTCRSWSLGKHSAHPGDAHRDHPRAVRARRRCAVSPEER